MEPKHLEINTPLENENWYEGKSRVYIIFIKGAVSFIIWSILWILVDMDDKVRESGEWNSFSMYFQARKCSNNYWIMQNGIRSIYWEKLRKY